MHRALSSRDDPATFKPEPIDESDLRFWIDDIADRATRIVQALEHVSLNAKDRSLAERLLQIHPRLREYAADLIRLLRLAAARYAITAICIWVTCS